MINGGKNRIIKYGDAKESMWDAEGMKALHQKRSFSIYLYLNMIETWQSQ